MFDIEFIVYDTIQQKFIDEIPLLEEWIDSEDWDDSERACLETLWQKPPYQHRLVWLPYIGALDKWGNKLFCNDIVRNDQGDEFVIFWQDEDFCWLLKRLSDNSLFRIKTSELTRVRSTYE